jgi:hypothetical protein
MDHPTALTTIFIIGTVPIPVTTASILLTTQVARVIITTIF